MEGESGGTVSIIDELHSSYFQGDKMEDESDVTGNIIDELHSSDTKEIKWKVKVVLPDVSLMNSTLRIW